MKARQNCLASLYFFRFQAARTICLNSFNPNLELFLIWNLESSSLVNAVFGVVDFLEFLLGCTAHIFAQCCYLVRMMLERHLAVSGLHLIV